MFEGAMRRRREEKWRRIRSHKDGGGEGEHQHQQQKNKMRKKKRKREEENDIQHYYMVYTHGPQTSN